MDCNGPAYTKPVRLLPPHSAPLSMLYYDGAMFPQLRGKLLIALHGYRPAGARIAAFTVDRRGIPLLTPNAHYDAYAGPNGDRDRQPALSGTGVGTASAHARLE